MCDFIPSPPAGVPKEAHRHRELSSLSTTPRPERGPFHDSGLGPFSRVKRPSICPTVFGLNYLIGIA